MPKKERDIRIVGKRRAFEVGRFVMAIVAHAEALSEAEARAEAARAEDATTDPDLTGSGTGNDVAEAASMPDAGGSQ